MLRGKEDPRPFFFLGGSSDCVCSVRALSEKSLGMDVSLWGYFRGICGDDRPVTDYYAERGMGRVVSHGHGTACACLPRVSCLLLVGLSLV